MSVLNFNVNGVSKSTTKLESTAKSFSITIDEPEDLEAKMKGQSHTYSICH